ncbi:phenylacetaldehyde dehydrogenase [Novosphingobium hassiacum]|uniref:Phenylacetaldehyde dehydrogenase n=1 Tax=Novosphingobium hassiacum TaxID=173676 RepID=A0A7W5ZXX7_9SPHN|nr:aldehyde dehydrogenase family protein [Novosphingobium hassiacum]MBB3861297.1 phenylacetaldehyde dehydrogenase [Novosphingobium hassiacum]
MASGANEARGAEAIAETFLASGLGLWIDGRDVPAVGGARRDVVDPSTGAVVCSVAEGTAQDVDIAVIAARKAFNAPEWRKLKPLLRERMLHRLADLIERDADILAQLEARDTGKILPAARYGDVVIALDSLRYTAGWTTKIEGTTITPSFSYIPDVQFSARTVREPVGVVGQIIPWNFPLVMAIWKIAPALAAGCTVVLKPAEDTPLSALYLARLVDEAGIPAGVVNIVTGGREVGVALVEHPDVDKIAFTGSTSAGQDIQRRAASTMKRLSLELGGKSPVVVLADCPVPMAVEGAAGAIFFNHGQVCTAGSRLIVHRSIYEDVVQGLAAAANGMTLGTSDDPQAQMGPLISARQRDRVKGFVEGALAQGARLVAGGTVPEGDGFFYRPTVLADGTPEMTIFRDEVFGPVVIALPFDTEEEALRLANDTCFGLGASVWTSDLHAANRFASGLKAGNVWINAHNILDPAVPFGGWKMSGYGHELGHSAIELYTEVKAITMPLL